MSGTGSETNISLAGDLLNQGDNSIIEVLYSLTSWLSMHSLSDADSGHEAKGVFWSSTCGVDPLWFEVSYTTLETCW